MTEKVKYSHLGKPLIITPIRAVIISLLVGFCILEYVNFHISKQNNIDSLNTLTSLLSYQLTPILAYNDRQKAETILHQLKNQTDIVKATVYDLEDNIFAQYNARNEKKTTDLQANVESLLPLNILQIEKNIVKKEQKLGKLVLIQQNKHAWQNIENILLVLLALVITGVPIGYFFGKRLQARILKPIKDVFQQIDDFSHTDDLSLRITTKRNDELGYLVDSVNNAHARFQAREQLLEQRVTDKIELFYQTRQLSDQLFEQTITPILIIDHKQKNISNNPAFRRTFGFNTTNLSLQELLEKIGLADDLKQALLSNQAIITETLCANAKKEQIHTRVSNPDTHSDTFQIIFIEDLSQKKQIEEALFTEKTISQTILDSIGDAVITTSLNNEIQYMNPAAEKLTGRSHSEVTGLPLSDLLRIFDSNNKLLFGPNQQSQETTAGFNQVHDCFVITLDGKNRQVEYCATPLFGHDSTTLGKVITLRDVSELRHLSQKMEHHLVHDKVTGLLNRDAFKYRMDSAFSGHISPDNPISVLYIDLDKFQLINSICGNEAGDVLLQKTAQQIKEKTRSDDAVARMEADKFAVLLTGCPNDRALILAEHIRTIINSTDFIWDEKRYEISASIGLLTSEIAIEKDVNILSICETACFKAKENGGNHIQNQKIDADTPIQKSNDTAWITRINDALQHYHFELMQQTISPINSSISGKHFEILLRMRDEHGNLVPPGIFLPTAERYHMMQKLDSWVINTAISKLIENKDLLANLELCSINLSAQTLHNETFLNFITDLFNAASIPSEKICFEITETAAVSNFTQAVKFINTLKKTGCRFALDDFGTGMSSFAYLKKLPVDFLKIDGAFVKNIVNDPIDYMMVKSINDIGHSMGLQTVAEFVEDDLILEKLKKIGVDYAQGYGIAKPEAFYNSKKARII
jgi:diguanylate cyclase (GGDEF)-like protein/PAS domain S-box-containing protein